jgi:hypothetical protein
MRLISSLCVAALFVACSSTPTGEDGSEVDPTGGGAGSETTSSANAGSKQNSSGAGGAEVSATGGAQISGAGGTPSSTGAGGKQNVGGAGGAPNAAGAGGAAAGGGGSADAGSVKVDSGTSAIDGGTGGSHSVSYATSFDANESPLSEGGRWKHNDVWFTKVVANGGNAYGTSPNPANQGKYEDSYAFLGGMGFPPNQYASGTVYKRGTTGGYLEIELQLRVSDSANSTRGYECFLHQGGAYISVARWRGTALSAPASIAYFDILGEADNITPPKDGDLYEAQIVGNIITVKLAGSTILTVDVSKFDGVVIPSGDPGIGFDAGGSGAETADSTYGFKDFFAKGL